MSGLLEAPPSRVLIVMTSSLGDVVQALPVAVALKRAWPATRISWVAQPIPRELLLGHPAIDEVIPFQRRRGLAAWRSYRELRERFANESFDLALALQVYFKAGLMTALAPAAIKLGFDRARARDLNWLFTTHRVPPRPIGHVQDDYFELLEALGVPVEPVEWRIGFDADERARQRSFFDALDRPACAVVVATSKPEKNWYADRYARLIERLEGELGFRCVLVGGPSALERGMADEILSLTRARPVDALGDSVRRLAWLLDGSALAISPDTAPLHIARALETPVIGLYGYTNPKRWGPYRKYTDLVVDGYARTPGEVYPPSRAYRRDGMSRITVERVMDKARLAVETYL